MQVQGGNFTTFTDRGIKLWEVCEKTKWVEARFQALLQDSEAPTAWESCGASGLLSANGGFVFRGMVDEQVDNWGLHFPDSAFCFLTMGALHKNSTAAIQRIAAFVGVDPTGAWSHSNQRQENPHSHPKQALHDEVAAIHRLREFYRKRSDTYSRVVANGGWLNC